MSKVYSRGALARLTRTQVRRIKRLLSKGKWTQAEIAKKLGCSIHAVRHIAKGDTWTDEDGPPPTNLAYDKLSDAVVREIVDLRKKGIAGTEIAERLGVSNSTVYRYLRAAGFTRESHGRVDR